MVESVVSIEGFTVRYVGRDILEMEILGVEPSLQSLSTARLFSVLKRLKRRETIKEAVIHGYDVVLIKLIFLIESEIKQRVGGELLKCLDQLQQLSFRSKSTADEVRDAVQRCLEELGRIPLRYLPLFRYDIDSTIRYISKYIEYRRRLAMNILEDQVKRLVEGIERWPVIADYTIETFLENMNSEYDQSIYANLEIADVLEEFTKAMRMMNRELTIRIRLTPDMLEKIYSGDYTEICEQVTERIKSLIA